MEKVIRLEGRIDSVNGFAIEKKVFSQIDKDTTSVIFDLEDLNYISSTGLRIVLTVKKKIGNVKVINCSSDVYDVFEITGYTTMMPITRKYKEVSIDGCEQIGEGFFGDVYRLDDERIVKVYRMPNSLKMINREMELSKKAFTLGIPTAIPFEIVKVGDLYGTVFELLHAKSVKDIIKSEKSIKDFCKKSVKVLKQLHSIDVGGEGFPSRREQFVEMLYESKEYFTHKLFENFISMIATIPESNTILHSDFHVKNIMMQKDELLLIDMDTLSRGHPIFEFAAMYACYVAFSCIDKDNSMKFFGISDDISKEIFDLTFNGYYADKTEQEKEDILEKISVIAYLKVMSLRAAFADKNSPTTLKEIEFCLNHFKKMFAKLDTLYY